MAYTKPRNESQRPKLSQIKPKQSKMRSKLTPKTSQNQTQKKLKQP